jgi:signal transduction histidine kinase
VRWRRKIDKVVRTRWALPLLIAVSLLAAIGNELSFQETRASLSRGVALTDARMQAARTLQMLTRMEAAARAYDASGDVQDRHRFDGALHTLTEVRDDAMGRLDSLFPNGREDIGDLDTLIDAVTARLRRWIDTTAMAGAGSVSPDDNTADLASIAALGREFDGVLLRAAGAHQQARLSLREVFQLNRWTVHGLLLVSVLGLMLYRWQLRQSDVLQAGERERLAGEVAQRTAQLRELAGHLVDAREDERGRLARELHDEMGGLLTAMKLELARLRRVGQLPATALERAQGLEARLNEGIALKRRIIENLRPSSLDQLGLGPALRLLCEDVASVSGVPVHAELQDVQLDDAAELTLYRVVQESLNNACKYAAAQSMRVQLSQGEGQVRLEVADDGRGFDLQAVGAGRHGIAGMQVRVESHGGRLQVHSRPGGGTRIVATVPACDRAPMAADESAPPLRDLAMVDEQADRSAPPDGLPAPLPAR